MLDGDLDFSDTSLVYPLGASSDTSCVAYSGVFRGNGYSIKGLKMNNADDNKYRKAGLFCGVKDATVENLVIDSTCFFSGTSAGALSVTLLGSLTLKNVTNKANVEGNNEVGGFIGSVKGLKQEARMSFGGCVNSGFINGTGYYAGGFVGYISNNNNITITISDSTSVGNVISNGNNIGGFVGFIDSNSNVVLVISNSTNNNTVNGTTNVGGFVGYILQSKNMIMTVFNSTNNGAVIGGEDVGGFVGVINCKSTSNSVKIISSANKASVTSERGIACGLFCVDTSRNNGVKTTVLNSINRGTVNGNTSSFGITNNITMAKSVVSIGDVTCSSDDCFSFTFWNAKIDAGLLFAKNGKCTYCSVDAKLIEFNQIT